MSDEAAPSLDRALQRSMLEAMRVEYPLKVRGFSRPRGLTAAEIVNLSYLGEHGLCEHDISISGQNVSFATARITARGLDFLADDGGLSAILGVVTVKLHADTIRDLIAAKIEASALPLEKKAGLKAALTRLSSAALQAGVTDLAKMGLEHGPDAAHWIERLVGAIS